MKDQEQLETVTESIERLTVLNNYMLTYDLLKFLEKQEINRGRNRLKQLFEMSIAELNILVRNHEERYSCKRQQYGQFVSNFEENEYKVPQNLIARNDYYEESSKQEQSINLKQSLTATAIHNISNLQILDDQYD